MYITDEQVDNIQHDLGSLNSTCMIMSSYDK